jgi:membrane-associated phospholipid phosphatase
VAAPDLLAVAAATPADLLALLAALVTQLADAWLLISVLSLGYWLAPRVAADPRAVAASLVGLAFAALAASLGLKALFALPRPAGAATVTPPALLPPSLAELFRGVATSDGYGFPSGHATAAAAVYGGCAAFLDVGTRRDRWLVAGGVTAAVAASRVVLGLHSLGQVIAGVVCGATLLWLATRVSRPGLRPRPDRLFFGVALVGLAATLATGLRGDGESVVVTAVSVGGGVGGYLVWRLRGPDDTPVGVGGALLGLALAAVPFGYAGVAVTSGVPAVLGWFVDTVALRAVAAALASAVAVAFVLLWPTLLGQLRLPVDGFV